MYQRLERAAVAVGGWKGYEGKSVLMRQRPQTLWAERPFKARQGHVIALRLMEGKVSVRWVKEGVARWVPADQVLTEEQARAWGQTGRFKRS